MPIVVSHLPMPEFQIKEEISLRGLCMQLPIRPPDAGRGATALAERGTMPMPEPTVDLLRSSTFRRGLSLVVVIAATGSVISPDPALASATHVVVEGETLSGI